MKLNLKDKHKIIELYEKGYTISQLCKQFNVKHSTIKRIERQYREHGISCCYSANYIDYYNNKRISTKLKGLTPIMYRHQSNNNVILN